MEQDGQHSAGNGRLGHGDGPDLVAVELIPKEGPLRHEMGVIGVACVVGHGPWQELARRIKLDGASRDGSRFDIGNHREGSLGGKRQSDRYEEG